MPSLPRSARATLITATLIALHSLFADGAHDDGRCRGRADEHRVEPVRHPGDDRVDGDRAPETDRRTPCGERRDPVTAVV